jgi:putative transposase
MPYHVTLKVRRGIESLRTFRVVREIEASCRKACERTKFRLVHSSIQDDHAHLIVEASNADELGRGMMSIASRFARAVNRALKRTGPVLADGCHLRVLG